MILLVASLDPIVSPSQNRSPLQAVTIVAAASSSTPSVALAQAAPASAVAIKHGQRRPDFKLKDIDGNLRSVSEWDGKLIVLNFWATWCPPCVDEISTFNRLQDEYAGAGVQFLGVARDNVQDVKRFIAKHGMRYPTLYASQEAMDLSKSYGNKYDSLPYTVVIGRNGMILHTHAGALQRVQVQALIRDALRPDIPPPRNPASGSAGGR